MKVLNFELHQCQILESPLLLIFGGSSSSDVEVIEMSSNLSCIQEATMPSPLNGAALFGLVGFLDGEELVICDPGVVLRKCAPGIYFLPFDHKGNLWIVFHLSFRNKSFFFFLTILNTLPLP